MYISLQLSYYTYVSEMQIISDTYVHLFHCFFLNFSSVPLSILYVCTYVGEGNYGDRSVTDFGRAFLEASQQNPHMFAAPGVAFAFFDGITKSVAGYNYVHT